MKSISKSVLPVACAAALFAPGCADLGAFLAGSPTVRRPEFWRPELPVSMTLDELSTGNRPLRADDQVNVTVISTADGSVHSEDIVDAAGYVTLPLVGEVRLGGLTTTEAEKFVADTYRNAAIYNNPTVKVVCPNMIRSLSYSVTGAVGKRGSYAYKEGMTLQEAIIEAGDLGKFANGTVVIKREGRSKSYDMDRIRSGRDVDPPIRPRDIIEAKEKLF